MGADVIGDHPRGVGGLGGGQRPEQTVGRFFGKDGRHRRENHRQCRNDRFEYSGKQAHNRISIAQD